MELSDAEKLAKELMAEHGLNSWEFAFDNSKSRFGVCFYRRKRISLSRYLVELNDVEQVHDTILHEIAHAVVGGENGHNDTWKKVAQGIGCTGERCYSTDIVKTVPKAYTGTCPNASCGRRVKRHRRNRRLCCGNCLETTGEYIKFKWKKDLTN